jgi:fructokinase
MIELARRARRFSPPTKRMGIDLGGTKIEGIVLDEMRREIFRTRIPTERERGYDHVLGRVATVVTVLREYAPESRTLGIGTPGSLSRTTGLLKNSNTTCLNGRPLRDDLEARLGLSVRIENDANCFALAEARLGAGRNHDLVFGVILGTGVGGGLVFRGEPWSGPQHIAGEWGHHSIDPRGAPCYCGQRGCVETLLCGPTLEAAYVTRTAGARGSATEILARAQEGENAALDVVKQYLEHFGRALANVISILDPDVVVLGGGLSKADLLYTAGRQAVARYVFNDELTTPIERNQLGDSAGVIGAALLPGR